MDLFELTASLTLDTSGYEKDVNSASQSGSSLENSLNGIGSSASGAEGEVNSLGGSADNTSGKFSAFEVALGNFIANAVEKLISKVGEAVQEIIELGNETEYAFAKLETISGKENIDDLTESIIQLSKETGVSAQDLADVAYNAISAGASAETAMDMVESATKLGVAGFTSSSDALSVLSTAMNAYGDEAGSVQEISDSLIMTQNLGVTTVGDLSSAIGRAIATGSAYGVSLGNIESAYVSLTKGGIETRQATTYLNSMMSELGDTGSTVSGIIQDKTGKSFTELMDSGSSLADVIKILYEAVDEDATALTNLWSSSTAGMASNAILNQGFQEFNDTLEAVTNSAGATEDAYAVMADTMTVKNDRITTGFEAIGLEIYNGLQEPLSGATDFILDTFLPNLEGIVTGSEDIFTAVGEIVSGGTEFITDLLQSIIEALPDIITGIVEFLVASSGDIMVGALDMLNGIVEAIPDFIDTLLESLPELIDSIFEFFNDNHEQMIESAINLLMSIVEAIPEIVNSLVENLPQIIESIVSGLVSSAPQVLSGAISMFMAIIEAIPTIVVSLVTALPEIISTIIDALAGAIPEVLQGAKDLLMQVIEAVPEIVKEIPEAIGNIIEGIVQGLLGGVTKVFDAAKNLGSNILGGIKSFLGINSPSTVMEEQGQYITEGLVQGIESMPSQIESILASVEAIITNWGANAVNTIAVSAQNMLTGFISVISQLPDQLNMYLTTALENTLMWSENMQVTANDTATNVFTIMSEFLQMLTALMLESETTLFTDWSAFSEAWLADVTTTTDTILLTFMQAMEQLITAVATALSTIMSDTASWGSEMQSQFYSIGQNVINGMIQGLDSESGRLYSKIRSIMRQMISEAEDELDIGSPSKVFRNDIGAMVGEGVALGIEDSAGAVAEAMEELINATDRTDEFERVMRGYASASVPASSYNGGQNGRENEGAGITVIQNIYSEAKTASDLMREARYEQQRAVLMGVG